jgi:hypothetical protein
MALIFVCEKASVTNILNSEKFTKYVKIYRLILTTILSVMLFMISNSQISVFTFTWCFLTAKRRFEFPAASHLSLYLLPSLRDLRTIPLVAEFPRFVSSPPINPEYLR